MAERGFGRVVNITLAAVKTPCEAPSLGNVARTGLTGFVAGLARSSELGSHSVTPNSRREGPFDTDRLRSDTAAVAKKSGRGV